MFAVRRTSVPHAPLRRGPVRTQTQSWRPTSEQGGDILGGELYFEGGRQRDVPASLFEAPHDMTICLNCHGVLVSYGQRIQTGQGEQRTRGDDGTDEVPTGDGQQGDGQQGDDDVDMDEEEVEELARKAKETAKEQQEADDREEEHKHQEPTSTPMETDEDDENNRPGTPRPDPGTGVHSWRTWFEGGWGRKSQARGSGKWTKKRGKRDES